MKIFKGFDIIKFVILEFIAIYFLSETAFYMEVGFMRKTKIVCTLGPSTDKDGILEQLMLEGMNVARFNFSHEDHFAHKKRFDMVCMLREKLNLPVATLLDTKGPEIRLGVFKEGFAYLKPGQTFNLYIDEVIGDEDGCFVTYAGLINDVKIGSNILIDDGLIDLEVCQICRDKIVCVVKNGGKVSNRKGVNIPDCSLSLPFINEKDRNDIIFGIQQGFDFIAASFTRSAADIQEIRKILNNHNCHDINIIAKIENREGVENIDEILKVADGIMVARGDMGVEIPFEELPYIQKMLIHKASCLGKIVITATQMLDSMITNPRPTRAEISDVANAIYDGTSAIMLSGETAAGNWPIEAFNTMVKIALETESRINYKQEFLNKEAAHEYKLEGDMTKVISLSAITTAHNLDAAAIIAVSMTGKTAQIISSYRPNSKIIGFSPNVKVCRQLNLSFGVVPIFLSKQTNTDDLFDSAINLVKKYKLVKNNNTLVLTAGIPLGFSGTTNIIRVKFVGKDLARGIGINRKNASGKICVAYSESEARNRFCDGDILVAQETSDNILDLIKKCGGIITETVGKNSHASILGMFLDKPVIIGVKNATSVFKNGMRVNVDAQTGRITEYNDN